MVSQRTLDLMAFVAEHSGDRTHPDGCMAVTFADSVEAVVWPYRVCHCPHDHPNTIQGLQQQYADNEWVNIDA